METFIILANALAQISHLDIKRLDILYDDTRDEYSACLWLGNGDDSSIEFILKEDGTVSKE